MACRRKAPSIWGSSHTIRFGLLFQADDLVSATTSLVLPTAPGGVGSPNPNPLCTDPAQTCQTSATPLSIADNSMKHAWNVGVYIQDEWKLASGLTFNYGVRYDEYSAFAKENQVSPRASLVWKPAATTPRSFISAIRAISRRRPMSLSASEDIALFDNTTSAADHTDTTPKAERADYYDAGVTHKLTDEISVGLDSYFKSDSQPAG